MSLSWSLDDVDLVGLDILVSRIALSLKAGDVIALSGPLGVGKTTFARSLVTRLGGEDEVPSPTFALMQRYETKRLTLTHCDLYRLEPSELDELGLEDALGEGVVLIEWPERATCWLPADRLDIAMDETALPNLRRIVFTAHGNWEPRLTRLRELRKFLDNTPYAKAGASYLQGDASTRSYARLVLPSRVLDLPLPQVGLIDMRHDLPRGAPFQALSPALVLRSIPLLRSIPVLRSTLVLRSTPVLRSARRLRLSLRLKKSREHGQSRGGTIRAQRASHSRRVAVYASAWMNLGDM